MDKARRIAIRNPKALALVKLAIFGTGVVAELSVQYLSSRLLPGVIARACTACLRLRNVRGNARVHQVRCAFWMRSGPCWYG